MRIDADGVGIEVHDEGSGPAVVLLHGWPDSHRMWRHQIAALAAAGFHVIAPDLRGFGASDRPDTVAAYSMRNAVGDVLAVLDHLGVERAHVVGHDWGAALAWTLAAFVPDRVDHLVVLSVGHPQAVRAAGLAQREKSWYMLLFQFPGIAERWLADGDFANLQGVVRPSRHRRRGRRPLTARSADGEPQLVPGQRPARVPDHAVVVPRRRRPDARRVELGRLRPHGAPDGRVGGVGQRLVALRTDRRRRALDDARRPGCGVPPAR